MPGERFRQWIAVTRAADVEGDAAGVEMVAHAARARVLLVEHDQDGLAHGEGQ
jgi:hypothetical protein